MLCSERSLVKSAATWAVAIPLYCRSWHCDICRPRRQQQLIALGKAGQPNRFLTLTTSAATAKTPAEKAKALASAFRLLIKRARRLVAPGKVEYCAVFEATKLGNPHLHILLRSPYLAQAWISAAMRELAGAPIVDIRQVKSAAQAASYVSKYIGKEPERFGTCKRYWTSGNWDLRTKEDNPEDGSTPWSIVDLPLKELWRIWYFRQLRPSWQPGEWLAHGKLPPHIAKWATGPPSDERAP